MYVALKNRKTFWLLRNRGQDTCLLHTSTKTQASLLATNSIPKQPGLQKLSSSPAGDHEWRKRISDPACALRGGNFSYKHGDVWDLTSLFLTVRFRVQPNHERELWQHESVNGSLSSRKQNETWSESRMQHWLNSTGKFLPTSNSQRHKWLNPGFSVLVARCSRLSRQTASSSANTCFYSQHCRWAQG